jgi:hypothetical protein
VILFSPPVSPACTIFATNMPQKKPEYYGNYPLYGILSGEISHATLDCFKFDQITYLMSDIS